MVKEPVVSVALEVTLPNGVVTRTRRDLATVESIRCVVKDQPDALASADRIVVETMFAPVVVTNPGRPAIVLPLMSTISNVVRCPKPVPVAIKIAAVSVRV